VFVSQQYVFVKTTATSAPYVQATSSVVVELLENPQRFLPIRVMLSWKHAGDFAF